MQVFVIDPGHGWGQDQGATGNSVVEQNVTLAVGELMARQLQQAGVDARLTRDRDLSGTSASVEQSLEARCAFANQAGADGFLSIHCNAAGDPAASGTETYALAPGGQGERLAGLVQSAAVLAGDLPDRGVKFANFQVLRDTAMPAALVELGFVTNPGDAAKLADPAWQAEVAGAIASACLQWLGQAAQPPVPPANAPAPGTPICGAPQATVDQARAWAASNDATAAFGEVLTFLWLQAPQVSSPPVRPEVAAAVAAKETGFGRFGGTVTPDMHNWGGLKTAAGGADTDPAAHQRFPGDATGARALLQHLATYAGAALTQPVVDERARDITPGSAPTVEQLQGRYNTNPGYVEDLVAHYLGPLLATPATAAAPPADKPGDPAADVAWLKSRGLIQLDHRTSEPVSWGQLATVLRRLDQARASG